MHFSAFNEDYVRRLASGDPEVEKHFTAYFGSLLFLKLRTRLRSRQLVDDVRQETFLRVLQVLRKEGGVHNPERLGAFVNSVCNNVLLETFRAAGKHGQAPEDPPDRADPAIDVVTELVSRERKETVRRVLLTLPAKDRDLLRMIFLEERDKSDICEEMKVSGDYLRVLLHRAKSKFREAIGREGALENRVQ